MALLQCYQGFMQRLEQAIAQQRATVQLANARLEQARQTLEPTTSAAWRRWKS